MRSSWSSSRVIDSSLDLARLIELRETRSIRDMSSWVAFQRSMICTAVRRPTALEVGAGAVMGAVMVMGDSCACVSQELYSRFLFLGIQVEPLKKAGVRFGRLGLDRKSTRLNSSHV